MSLRLEMLQVARLSPRLLSDGTELVAEFISNQVAPNGGFMGRGGEADLYYTVFGLGCMAALDMPIPEDKMKTYLHSFGSGKGLDLVHLSALIRSWAGLGGMPQTYREQAIAYLEGFRKPNGGFNTSEQAEMGDAYGSFIALGAYQDLGLELPDADRLPALFQSLRSKDGGYGNEPNMPVGATPITAAAISVLRSFGMPIPPEVGTWLRARFYEGGGFYAIPYAPMPDLLSTAVALHGLVAMEYDLDDVREQCLDYIDSLWVNKGSFFGNWGDDILDCEYTFYGLLALGHLSL